MTNPRSAEAPLRFATFLAPNMLPVYRCLADQIAQHLGRTVELIVGTSFEQFVRGDADYDDIRAKLATIRAAGWTSLAQATTAPQPPQGSAEGGA